MNPLALVIENDAGTRKLLTVLLSRIGCEVDAVPTGSAAMVLLDKIEYDVVFVDLMIPDVGGAEIVGWLARERPSVLPRVIVLSSAAPAHLQTVREMWPETHVFRKPFELEEVISVAQSVIDGRTSRESLAFGEQFVRNSVRAGAKSGVVVTTNGMVAERVLDFGYAQGVAASYFPMPVDCAMPLCASIRDARPVWLASARMATLEYPLLEPVFTFTKSHALATVPLMRGGEVVGAAGWSFREPRQFGEIERQVLAAIADSVVEWLPRETAARA